MRDNFRYKVSAQFEGNPSIKFIESSVEVVESNAINFDVRMIQSLANKPTLAQNKEKAKKDTSKPFDPFVPPFEPGLFIDELSLTHNLLFNKFCICREHVLVVTKEMER